MNAITEKGRLLSDDERLDPAQTALVLIDIQNDFCHPGGVFGKQGHDLSIMQPMVEHTRVLLDAARRKGMLIVFVRATYDGEVLSGPLAETYHRRGFIESQCPEGSFGAGWYGGLAPDPEAPNEVAVTKHRFSAFWGTDFDLYLRANGIRSLVFAGVVTSGCVESSLRDAFFRDYYVVAAADCVAEASPERHTAALHKIEQAFGAVRDAAAIAAVWDRAPAVTPKFSAAAKRSQSLRGLPARLDPAHCALLLIGLQRDFCGPDGAMALAGDDLRPIEPALKAASTLLAAARASGMQVVHVRSEYGETDASGVSLLARETGGIAGGVLGTPGANFMPEVAPRRDEWIVTKRRFSAFVDTRLELLLRSNGIRSVCVAGVATPCCVESTVRDASMRDYPVVVAREAVAAPARMSHLHAMSLETMALFFADCRPLAEILAVLSARATAAA